MEKKYKYQSGGRDNRLDQVDCSQEKVKCYGPHASCGLHSKALLCPYSRPHPNSSKVWTLPCFHQSLYLGVPASGPARPSLKWQTVFITCSTCPLDHHLWELLPKTDYMPIITAFSWKGSQLLPLVLSTIWDDKQ